MYSLWNANFFDIGKRNIKPFSFKINDKEKEQSKFRIEELDYFTSSYKSESAFITELANYSDKYISITSNKPIIIAHETKGNLYEDGVIYDDNLILVASAKKRNSKTKKQKYLLKNNEIVTSFIKEIKEFALDPYTSSYLLTPEVLSDIIPLRLKTLMINKIKGSKKFYDKKSATYKLTPKAIKDYLKDYAVTKKAIQTNRELFQSTLYLDEQLNSLEEKINSIIRTDYLTLRNLVSWENDFLKALEIKKNNASDENELININYNITRIKLAKEFRNSRITKQEYEEKVRNLQKNKKEKITGNYKKN